MLLDFTIKERVLIVVTHKVLNFNTRTPKRCKRAKSADIGNFRVYRKRVSE